MMLFYHIYTIGRLENLFAITTQDCEVNVKYFDPQYYDITVNDNLSR